MTVKKYLKNWDLAAIFVCAPLLALVLFCTGCACNGEAGGKVAGGMSASDQVYPWADRPAAAPAK